MEWNQRVYTIKAMQKFGGGFVKALGDLWQHADADNSARIEASWPEYIAKYSKLADDMRNEEQ